MASTKPKTIQLLLPHPTDDKMVKISVDDSMPAHEQQNFFKAFMSLIDQTRRSAMSTTEHQMILYAMKRKNCTPSECASGFWSAFDDPYVPASGVEWRHIVKHIDQSRGVGDSTTYRHDMTDDEIEALRKWQETENQ